MDEKKDHSNAPELDTPQNQVASTYIKPQHRKVHDPDVTFEEYHWYALRTREEEKHYESPKLNWREVMSRKKTEQQQPEGHNHDRSKSVDDTFAHSNRIEITDEEWTNASRAFRTASWGACE